MPCHTQVGELPVSEEGLWNELLVASPAARHSPSPDCHSQAPSSQSEDDMHRETMPRRGSAGERVSGGEAKLSRAKPRDKVGTARRSDRRPIVPQVHPNVDSDDESELQADGSGNRQSSTGRCQHDDTDDKDELQSVGPGDRRPGAGHHQLDNTEENELQSDGPENRQLRARRRPLDNIDEDEFQAHESSDDDQDEGDDTRPPQKRRRSSPPKVHRVASGY